MYGEIETDKVGVIVERLDQVLMGLRSPLACACETFFMRLGSTKSLFLWIVSWVNLFEPSAVSADEYL